MHFRTWRMLLAIVCAMLLFSSIQPAEAIEIEFQYQPEGKNSLVIINASEPLKTLKVRYMGPRDYREAFHKSAPKSQTRSSNSKLEVIQLSASGTAFMVKIKGDEPLEEPYPFRMEYETVKGEKYADNLFVGPIPTEEDDCCGDEKEEIEI